MDSEVVVETSYEGSDLQGADVEPEPAAAKRRKKKKGGKAKADSDEDAALEEALETAARERAALRDQAAPRFALLEEALGQAGTRCPAGHPPRARLAEPGEACGCCGRELGAEAVVLSCPPAAGCAFVCCTGTGCLPPGLRNAMAQVQ